MQSVFLNDRMGVFIGKLPKRGLFYVCLMRLGVSQVETISKKDLDPSEAAKEGMWTMV